MTRPKAVRKLAAFDAARYLDDDAATAEYMTVVPEADDADPFLLALGDIARAQREWLGWPRTPALGERAYTRL